MLDLTQRAVLAAVLATVTCCAAAVAADAPSAVLGAHKGGVEVVLAEGGKAAMPIVLAADASETLKRVAAELADDLGRMTGAPFEVTDAGTGKVERGIVLGTLAQFPNVSQASADLAKALEVRTTYDGREAYVIRSEPNRLLLSGATDLGASHAAFRFLESQGWRWFFPAPEWTVVPRTPTLRVSIDESGRPTLLARRIWYGYGAFDKRATDDYLAWARHNRMGATSYERVSDRAGAPLQPRMRGSLTVYAGHAWQTIIANNKAVFEAHPEYLALHKESDKEAKAAGHDAPQMVRKGEQLCVSNPAVQQIASEYALAFFEKNPDADMVSMECSDGLGHCECENCAKLGGVSNRVFGLANIVAKAVAAKYPSKKVGLLAYSNHSEPPDFALEPNVYVQLTAGFTMGKYTYAELLDLWPKKCRNLGFYDYFSVWLWDFDRLPGGRGGNLKYIRERIPEYVAHGATSIDCESGCNWGPHGRGYYIANRLMWDPKADVDALLADFYQQAFGPGAKPMKHYYERFDPGNNPLLSEDLVARGFRDVDEAAKLAKDLPDVQARLDDLKAYLHYIHLRWDIDATKDKEQRKEMTLALFTSVYRVRYAYMNHWNAIRQDWTTKAADPEKGFGEPSWSFKEKGSHPWEVDRPYTHEEIEKEFQAGLARFRLQNVIEKTYSADLVPAHLDGPAVATQHAYQGGLRYALYSAGGEDLSVRVVTGVIAWYRDRAPATWKLLDAKEVVVAEGRLPLDGETHEVKAKVAGPGLYWFDFADSGAAWKIDVDAGKAVTLPLRRDRGYSHTGTMQPFYFYVPKGTQRIDYYWRGGPHDVSGSDGKLVQHVDTSGKFVSIPVPAGADGKCWSMKASLGHLWFFNVPNYVASSPAQLLLPKEVVEKDGLK